MLILPMSELQLFNNVAKFRLFQRLNNFRNLAFAGLYNTQNLNYFVALFRKIRLMILVKPKRTNYTMER